MGGVNNEYRQGRWVESIMNRQGRWVESIMNIGRAGGWSQ